MPDSSAQRIFLVVVDESDEMPVALYYAGRRAVSTGGRVALLRVIPREESHGLASVEALMREEARQEAEQLMQRLAKTVIAETGNAPMVYIREGLATEETLALIEEDPTISILVMASGTGTEGPGPLVSYLVTRGLARLRIPIMIVPGNLTTAQIDAIT